MVRYITASHDPGAGRGAETGADPEHDGGRHAYERQERERPSEGESHDAGNRRGPATVVVKPFVSSLDRRASVCRCHWDSVARRDTVRYASRCRILIRDVFVEAAGVG